MLNTIHISLTWFKHQNISISHSSRSQVPHIPLLQIIHKINNCDIANDFIKILQIPRKLIGKKHIKEYQKLNLKKKTEQYHMKSSSNYLVICVYNLKPD